MARSIEASRDGTLWGEVYTQSGRHRGYYLVYLGDGLVDWGNVPTGDGGFRPTKDCDTSPLTRVETSPGRSTPHGTVPVSGPKDRVETEAESGRGGRESRTPTGEAGVGVTNRGVLRNVGTTRDRRSQRDLEQREWGGPPLLYSDCTPPVSTRDPPTRKRRRHPGTRPESWRDWESMSRSFLSTF